MKHSKGIKTKELSWHEFKRLFKNNHFFERYYDGKAKELYGMKMGSMIDEEYTTNFHDIFFSGLLLAFKDTIEFDEPWSLEEVIGKLKHYYE